MNSHNDRFNDLITSIGEQAPSTLNNIITGNFISIPLQVVTGTFFSMKQKKSEKMIYELLSQLIKYTDEINARLNSLERSKLQFIEDDLFPSVLNYASREQEKEKIRYYVNGFRSFVQNDISIYDIAFTYNDILEQLRVYELQKLLIYHDATVKNIDVNRTISEDIQREGYETYLVNKLENLGLISQYQIDEGIFGKNENPKIVDDYKDMKITDFGKNFIRYIRKEEVIKK